MEAAPPSSGLWRVGRSPAPLRFSDPLKPGLLENRHRMRPSDELAVYGGVWRCTALFGGVRLLAAIEAGLWRAHKLEYPRITESLEITLEAPCGNPCVPLNRNRVRTIQLVDGSKDGVTALLDGGLAASW